MSLLNRPSNGLASVLMALHRTLSAYGPQLESDLISLVAPQSMLADKKADMVKNTINRWRVLGFFVTNPNGTLQLGESIPKYSTANNAELRSAIVELVLRERNNTGILSSDADDDDKFPDASDLTRALAWMLAQDPFTFPDSLEDAERLQSEQKVVPKPFVNDTRWQGFKEWSLFLGFAMTPGGRFVPNPSGAVKPYLLRVLGDRDEMPIPVLLDELKAVLPVLDGGRYRLEVQTQIANPSREYLPHEISPSLSAAFLTFDASRDIRLESRSDAQQRALIGAKGAVLRQVSHIVTLRGRA